MPLSSCGPLHGVAIDMLDGPADVPRFEAYTILCHHIVDGRVLKSTVVKYEGRHMSKLRSAIKTTHRADKLGGALCDRDVQAQLRRQQYVRRPGKLRPDTGDAVTCDRRAVVARLHPQQDDPAAESSEQLLGMVRDPARL